MVKWALVGLAVIVLMLGVFGWVLPTLISSATNEGPILGVGIIVILIVVVAFIVDRLIKHDQKPKEKKRK